VAAKPLLVDDLNGTYMGLYWILMGLYGILTMKHIGL
jgi:hypothetical protein